MCVFVRGAYFMRYGREVLNKYKKKKSSFLHLCVVHKHNTHIAE